jgi:4'-phosphopantetheinyl transferase
LISATIIKKNLKGVPFKYSIKDIFPGAIGLELPNTTIPAILPPLRPWSKNPADQCAWDEIPAYWETYDVITFLADLGIYHPNLTNFLDEREKEQEQKFKTEYFKKRFTISRSIIKIVLLNILDSVNISDIVLIKENHGRLIVKGRKDMSISLSYSGTCIALSVGKRKVGSDIEVLRPITIRKITSSPLFSDTHCRNEKEHSRTILHLWTLVEAYSKLHTRNPYQILKYPMLPEDARFVSYCINQYAIFSLAFRSDPIRNALFWIDPKTVSSVIKNTAGLSRIYYGDRYVRA